jgi:GNAT superfamily N-acetyltransferase
MSEVIKGPWPDPMERAAPAKVPGSDWAMGLVQAPRAARVPAFRPLTAADQTMLWRWVHLAQWGPPQSPTPAEDWSRPTDIGIVAVVDGKDVGACWLRLLPEDVGLAFVDALTPQLLIALDPEFRRQGFGKALLCRALGEAWARGHPQVSLIIHSHHPAMGLFAACGFAKIGERDSYHLMLAPASR